MLNKKAHLFHSNEINQSINHARKGTFTFHLTLLQIQYLKNVVTKKVAGPH